MRRLDLNGDAGDVERVGRQVLDAQLAVVGGGANLVGQAGVAVDRLNEGSGFACALSKGDFHQLLCARVDDALPLGFDRKAVLDGDAQGTRARE